MQQLKVIFFQRADLAHVDTTRRFQIRKENGRLRVRNEYVNCIFSNLTSKEFDQIFNDYFRHLHLDFDSLFILDQEYRLTKMEQEKLIDTIITGWIYYYTINNLDLQVNKSDFAHPIILDCLLVILDKKYGKDTMVSLELGAKILRLGLDEYSQCVEGRRVYYDK